jgi:hypothetical protein
MKSITPITVWKDGVETDATQLTLTITFDNLETEAVFSYILSDKDNNALVSGLLPIDGSDYETWGQSSDANSDAYNYAANKLNLTFA